MKKSSTFEISPKLISCFIKAWNKHYKWERISEHCINMGWCYQFAVLTRKVYGEKVKLYSDLHGGHCWVKVGRLFYDSNHPKGTKHLLNMDSEYERDISEKRVCEIWEKRGGSGPVNYKVIEHALKLFKASGAK